MIEFDQALSKTDLEVTWSKIQARPKINLDVWYVYIYQ